ncbi:hypothetical protein ACN5LI_000047 [Cronobacter turicensis]
MNMYGLGKWLVFLLVFFSFQPIVNSAQLSPDDFWQQEQQSIDEDHREEYRAYKIEQNKLPDDQRDNYSLLPNEYWLIDKKQDLWLGFFDGKRTRVPGNIFSDIKNTSYLPQQVIRIKLGYRISQFLLVDYNQMEPDYPLHCYNKNDGVLLNAPEYLLFYSGCTNILLENNGRRKIKYDILFYSKTFDTMFLINEFDSFEAIDRKIYSGYLRNKDGYFIFDKTNIAFKINGKDKVENINPKTGLSLNMGSDYDSIQSLILKRLPEVIEAH